MEGKKKKIKQTYSSYAVPYTYCSIYFVIIGRPEMIIEKISFAVSMEIGFYLSILNWTNMHSPGLD